MRRSLSEYNTLRPGYARQQQQAHEKRMLQIARLKKSSRWLMVSLRSYLMMRKQEIMEKILQA